jgi:hypothetical protein
MNESQNLQELVQHLEEIKRRQTENRLNYYQPYPKQLEFHALGATKRERLFLAGNQLGKTFSGGAETAFHLTGLYPDWWPGRRFTGPTRGWAAIRYALMMLKFARVQPDYSQGRSRMALNVDYDVLNPYGNEPDRSAHTAARPGVVCGNGRPAHLEHGYKQRSEMAKGVDFDPFS